MITDSERTEKLFLLAYCVAGLPVVWLHVKQQKMLDSMRQVHQSSALGLIVYTLAVLWPILLFAMALTYFQPVRRKPQPTHKSNANAGPVPDLPTSEET
jgi:hypothetical protein